MLSRILLGVSASAIVASSQMTVAHAAAPASRPSLEGDIPPVYDDEVAEDPAPLPGTTLPSTSRDDTRLAESEAKLAEKLDVTDIRAEGRVYKVSKLLQGCIGQVRELLNTQLSNAEVKSKEWSHKYREGERSAAETVASLKSEKEDLLPESIYVLIAGLSGSIFARRRNLLVRAVTPWLFGGVAFAYFLPQTWSNVRSLAWHYEKQQFPTLAEKHLQAEKTVQSWTKESVETYDTTKKQVENTAGSVRDKIREWTGY